MSAVDPDAESEMSHERSLVVWDVPPTIGRGQQFAVSAGIRCDAACAPADWRLEIYDHADVLRATVAPDPQPWKGTDSLYAARVALEAPATDGLYRWRVIAPAVHDVTDAADTFGHAGASCAHEPASVGFPVRVVAPAECRLQVAAIDSETGQPVAGATVVMHPYRATTDAAGTALLAVPTGPYRLFVSGSGYFAFRSDGMLDGDASVRAELEPDRGPSDAEVWS